jgi:3D-(3,5/4)-trihydroxycyclohexane-1,2-dione acylhydrolase (decyclizing)
MSATVRLTAAQAAIRYLSAQFTEIGGKKLPLFAGCWAIFGHGNVAGLGEALYAARETLPTLRAHNEQAMAHSAIAYAKAMRRRRMMLVTSSIGPGALNMVTAAAVAHVNRIPVLFMPGDIFANRRPDPVLQQVEDFEDGTVSANDAFRCVSRYFDRISRPEQLIQALPRALAVLTDPAQCGPVTLAFPQDVQAEAFDYPASLFAEKIWTPRRPPPDERELKNAVAVLKSARQPVIIAGGGVLYSEAEADLAAFAERFGIPVVETQAGKSAIAHDHALSLGAVGVTGTGAANAVIKDADVVLAVGSRLQDFTTGSWALFQNPQMRLIALNTQMFDAHKHGAMPLLADAKAGFAALTNALGSWKMPAALAALVTSEKAKWDETSARYTDATNTDLPSDAQVIGAVQRAGKDTDIVVCASGGLPGELHKLWRAKLPGGYHLEYGFSCMGYEIAGALGIKMAEPLREVICMLGDGSYLMMNSEIASSIMLGKKLILIVLDNRGFGCINRLQRATGGESFNNLLRDTMHETLPDIDFAMHARSLGAYAEKVASLGDLEAAIGKARKADRTSVIVIDTDPLISTDAGGHWWDVAVPEVSPRKQVNEAHARYVTALEKQKLWN